jgi:hypothetical protein
MHRASWALSIVVASSCGASARPAVESWHACWLPGYQIVPSAGHAPYDVVPGPATTGVLALDASWDRHLFRSEYTAGLVALELPTDAVVGNATQFGAAHPLHYIEGSVGGFSHTRLVGTAIVRTADDHAIVVDIHGTRVDGPGPMAVGGRIEARRYANPLACDRE